MSYDQFGRTPEQARRERRQFWLSTAIVLPFGVLLVLALMFAGR